MPIYTVQAPDGKTYEIEGPTGATSEQLGSVIHGNTASLGQQIKQGAGNLAAGLVRGAGSIGATLLYPYDKTLDIINGDRDKNLSGLITGNQPISRNDERRQQIDAGLKSMGADPESTLYQGGKLAAEVAGTMGVGGAIANDLRSIHAVATKAPWLVNAIESGGFTLGKPASTATGGVIDAIKQKAVDAATRATGGAVVGGVSGLAVDPDSAGTSAVIGAALPGAVKVAATVGSKVSSLAGNAIKGTIGTMTGVGGEAVDTAIQAGRNSAAAFLDNLRGNVPMTDVLESAKDAVGKMRIARATEYKNGMAQVSGDKTVLDMTPITDAVNSVVNRGSFNGKVINKNAADKVQEVSTLVQDWAASHPDTFHTPEGLDALKKAVGDIRDTTQYGTGARNAIDQVYNAIKGQITAQAPVYAKTMQGYAEASSLINEIERALSLGNKSAADTSMRKLQSLMRNNVQTNYGNRLDLAKTLEQQGGEEILPAVAGQAMNSWMPRGMIGSIEKAGGLLGLLHNPASALPMAAAAPFASPRMMGEALYKYGALKGKAEGIASRYLPALMGTSNPALTGEGAVVADQLAAALLRNREANASR